MISINWCIVLFISFYTVSSVTSLQCYVCDEQDDKNCRRNVKSEYIRKCQTIQDASGLIRNPSGCSILISRSLYYQTKRVTNVRRNCYYGNLHEAQSLVSHDEGCLEKPNSQFTPDRCDFCEGDLCNDKQISKSSKIHSISIITIILLSIIISKLSL